MHTHRGNCQVCLSLQAVDVQTGRLAEHGYTVKFGWFMGSCAGSHKLPLNVSCEFLGEIKEEVRLTIEVLKTQVENAETVKVVRDLERRIRSGEAFIKEVEERIRNWQPTEMVEVKHLEQISEAKRSQTKAEREHKRAEAASRKEAHEAKRAAAAIWTPEMVEKAKAKAQKILSQGEKVCIYSRDVWSSHLDNMQDIEQWLSDNQDTGKIEVKVSKPVVVLH